MTRLTPKQIWEKLFPLKERVHEIVAWTADHGVKPEPKSRTIYRLTHADLVDRTVKDMRQMLLLIRKRCYEGFPEREEKLSKIKEEGKARE